MSLDDADPPRALRLHRAAADKGDVDSMREVVVRGMEDESRVNQTRLAERGDWRRLEEAAGRMEGARAEELRAFAAARAEVA